MFRCQAQLYDSNALSVPYDLLVIFVDFEERHVKLGMGTRAEETSCERFARIDSALRRRVSR